MTSSTTPMPAERIIPDGSPSAAGRARRALIKQMEQLGYMDAVHGLNTRCDIALLVVSELVGNAYRHAGSPREIRLSWQGHMLTIEVDDRSRTTPFVRPQHSRGESGGFGIAMISQLAESWGTTPNCHGSGKTVYAQVSLDPAA
ncbi:ATP-binding protein [Streptomyces sp. NPDC059985]|uniref:ATP-binding protein n=1 Tax=Streptomyces sp. NPDC059985 TaxID=3347025 RepID=UPI0036BE471E